VPDDFVTLSNRLLNRCPQAGLILCQQFVNDSWRQLQARTEWSFRRRHGTFAPANQYSTGTVSTNAGVGSPTLVTGTGTTWTASMVGRQIRIGGLLFPYYTIVSVLSPTSLLLDQPWVGPDAVLQVYQIMTVYFSVPSDFAYFYAVVSIKDGYKLWTNLTESELALLDPQRTNFGQTYCTAFYDYTANYGGTIGPIIPVAATGATPVSTTTTGYSYVTSATYIVQIVGGGSSGTATWRWMRSGQTSFSSTVATSTSAQNLQDGVQVYFPTGTYVAGDLFVINAISQITSGVPRVELWPAPTIDTYLYPYIYIAKESDLTVQSPQLPPFVANRGDVLLEMALGCCARFPGTDSETPNPYYDLKLSQLHDARAEVMLQDLDRNDQEVAVSNIAYENWPNAPAPWMDGRWQQTHAPMLY
jgi:hypothetical protein